MTLLAPWNFGVAAAVAVPLLLVLYFLKLRRKRLRVSSTMLWERAIDDLQVNEPFRWLRSSWLLVLQMLAVLSLALALGRPTLPGGGLLDDRVLLLIDTSASMRATDSPSAESRFEQARARAVELVEGLSGDAAVQVVAFGAEARALTGLSTDHGAALRAIRSLEPTDEPGSFAAVVELANALTAATGEGERDETRVVLISDGGSSDRTETLAGEPLLESVGPAADAELDNLGIVAAHLSRDYTDPTRLSVFLRIQSTLSRETAVSLRLALDGETTERLATTIPPASGGQLGTQTLTIDVLPGDARHMQVSLGRTDALEADNAVHFILPESEVPRVLLASPGDPLSWVVGDVISALPGIEVRTVGAAGLEDLLRDDGVADYDAVVLDRIGEPEAIPVPTLSFGLPLPTLALDSDDTIGSDRFVTWSREHAALRGLALDGISIASPRFFDGVSDEGDVLARGRRGPVIVDASDQRTRRIGVSFRPAESTWPIEISFPLFIAQALESIALSAGGEAGWIKTGVSNRLAIAPGRPPVLLGPTPIEGRELEPATGGRPMIAAFPGISQVGVYTDAAGVSTIGVNLLSPEESAIAVSDRVTLGGRTAISAGQQTGRREIWAWFVAIAATILTAEWALFVIRSRV